MVDSMQVGDVRWTIRPCACDDTEFIKPWRGKITRMYLASAFLCHVDENGVPDDSTNDGVTVSACDLFEHELDAWRMYKVSIESQMGVLNLALVESCDRVRELLNGGG